MQTPQLFLIQMVLVSRAYLDSSALYQPSSKRVRYSKQDWEGYLVLRQEVTQDASIVTRDIHHSLLYFKSLASSTLSRACLHTFMKCQSSLYFSPR